MARKHVDHVDLLRFAQERVNLPREKASEYRAQVNRLRDKLESYLYDHPDFTLRKMLLSGSLAKGTALRSINDIDVACYVSGSNAPRNVSALLNDLADCLRTAFPNLRREQVTPKTYSVTISFRGTGLDVDVVPILYDGDPDWYGNLLSQDDGTFLATCIPRHVEFIRRRKEAQETDFAQVVRLVKFWVCNVRRENEKFRFKSFMVELLLAHLADQGLSFADYPEALQHLFTYIGRTDLRQLVMFSDYYAPRDVGKFSERVRVIDPVNPKNNASRLYTKEQAEAIVNAALDAGDAVESALTATSKSDTARYWQKIFGPTFQV